MSTNMFEVATRKKLRFESQKGLLSVEDLWDLPLVNGNKVSLDDVAKGLYKKLKSEDTVSFVTPVSNSNIDTQLAFDIVKHIIDIRIVERDAAKAAADRATKKQAILAAIAKKEGDVLQETSLEDLRKMAESL